MYRVPNMFNKNMPTVKRLHRTNLDHDYYHSMLISVLRGLAAIQVAAAHIRAQFYPGLKEVTEPSLFYQAFAFFTGFAHQAVVVFFLLSGWLVGGALLNKYREKHCLVTYGIDRITRLWIVLIPAFGLSLLLGAVTGTVDPTRASLSPTNEFSVATFVGNLFGLQDMWVPRYGGNFALWSLANETWYYVLFPFLLTPWITKSKVARVFAAVAGIALASFLSFPILLFFAVWLMGAAASRLKIEASGTVKLGLLTLLAVLSIYFRLTGNNDKLEPISFGQDVALSAVFLALLCCLQTRADMTLPAWRKLKKGGDALAAFSFTLYVVHVPLILAGRHLLNLTDARRLSPHSAGDFAIYLVLLAAIVGFAYLFHLPFEAQTVRVRSKLKALLLGKSVKRDAPGASGLEPVPLPPASLFDTVILPYSKTIAASGKAPFAVEPDISRLSYYVRRTRSTMKPEDFNGASCADETEFEQCMAAHWTRVGRHDLAAHAGRFAAEARTARLARAKTQTTGDPSPYIYAMF